MTATGPAVTLQVRDDDKVLEPYKCGGTGPSLAAGFFHVDTVSLRRLYVPFFNGTCGWSLMSTPTVTTPTGLTERRSRARLPGVRIHPLRVQRSGFCAGTGSVA